MFSTAHLSLFRLWQQRHFLYTVYVYTQNKLFVHIRFCRYEWFLSTNDNGSYCSLYCFVSTAQFQKKNNNNSQISFLYASFFLFEYSLIKIVQNLLKHTELMSHEISKGLNKHSKITTGCGQIVKLPQGALRVI